MGLAAVLDQVEPVPPAHVDIGVHIAGVAEHVHGDYRPGARRDFGLDVRRVDVVAVVDVGEHGNAALEEGSGDASAGGPRGADHLVAGIRVDGAEDRVEGGGAGVDEDSEPGVVPVGELALEHGLLGPSRDGAGLVALAQHRRHGGHVIVAVVVGRGKRPRADGRPAVDSQSFAHGLTLLESAMVSPGSAAAACPEILSSIQITRTHPAGRDSPSS